MTAEVTLQVNGGEIVWPASTNGEQVFAIVSTALSVHEVAMQAIERLKTLQHNPGLLNRSEGRADITHPLIVCQSCGSHIDVFRNLQLGFKEGAFAICGGDWLPKNHYPPDTK